MLKFVDSLSFYIVNKEISPIFWKWDMKIMKIEL